MNASRWVRSLFFVVLLASSVALGQSPETSAVARLAERLLGYWGDPALSRAEIFPEALPAGIPFELPLPTDASLVGSVAHYERGELVTVQVVVDAPQAADDALASLLDAFAERGWIAAAMPPAVGFLPVQTHASGQACDPLTGIMSFMHATTRPSAPTDLRIDVNLASAPYNPPCHPASLVPQPYSDAAPMPALTALVGSQLVPHSTVQMPDQASSTAILMVDASLADVAGHYAGRLVNAEWRVDVAHVEAGYALMLASLVDEAGVRWHGILSVAASPDDAPTFALSLFVMPEDGDLGAAAEPRPRQP